MRKHFIGGICAIAVAAMFVAPMLRAAGGDMRVADAAMQGDHRAVSAFLKQGADVNGAQGDGMTALHWAATNDDVELAQILIAAGATPKTTTRLGGFTPLSIACRNGDAPMTTVLLAAGADVNATTTTGTTPLMLAGGAGNAATLKVLLDHGADPNAKETTLGQTALIFAAANNRADAITLLVARGADAKIATKVIDLAASARAGGGGRAGGARGGGRTGAPGATGAGNGRAGATGSTGSAQAGASRAGNAGAAASSTGNSGSATTSATQAGATPPVAGNAGPPQAGAPPAGAGAPNGGAAGRGRGAGGAATDGQAQAAGGGGNNGDDSRPAAIDFEGGLAPLHFAARQGHIEAARALLDAGADINELTGDKTSPMLIATINGHFDLANMLLEKGANPNLASSAGATPLYAALNVQWAAHAFYPQPSPAQEKLSHLEFLKALLDHGANPNVRLTKKLWYTGYNFDQSGVDAAGSTPFWRAAQASDLPAMKLLIAYHADATIPSIGNPNLRQGNGRTSGSDPAAAAGRTGGAGASGADASGLTSDDGPVKTSTPAASNEAPPKMASKIVPGVTPLQVAAGAGWDGNFHVNAPGGWMAPVKYLVEELGADVNEADYRGYTPLHDAAFRGDNEMILYLLSKGADPLLVTKDGSTAIDLANGPVQRLQPFPDTIAIFEKLGVKNNHRCKSCGGSGG